MNVTLILLHSKVNHQSTKHSLVDFYQNPTKLKKKILLEDIFEYKVFILCSNN